jgi:hypothetical protein
MKKIKLQFMDRKNGGEEEHLRKTHLWEVELAEIPSKEKIDEMLKEALLKNMDFEQLTKDEQKEYGEPVFEGEEISSFPSNRMCFFKKELHYVQLIRCEESGSTLSDISFKLNSDGYGYAFHGDGRVMIAGECGNLISETKDAIDQIYDKLWEDEEDGNWEEDPDPVIEHNGISLTYDLEHELQENEISIDDVMSVIDEWRIHFVFCESIEGKKPSVRDIETKEEIREILEKYKNNLYFQMCEYSFDG